MYTVQCTYIRTCNVLHMLSQYTNDTFFITVTDFVTLSVVMKAINHNSIVHIIYVKGQNQIQLKIFLT